MKIAITLLTAATSFLLAGAAQGQVESARIHISGMT